MNYCHKCCEMFEEEECPFCGNDEPRTIDSMCDYSDGDSFANKDGSFSYGTEYVDSIIKEFFT